MTDTGEITNTYIIECVVLVLMESICYTTWMFSTLLRLGQGEGTKSQWEGVYGKSLMVETSRRRKLRLLVLCYC